MAGVQKRKIWWAISLLLVMLYFSGLTAQAQYGGGTGEPNDPYQIPTAEDLMLLGESPEDYDKYFVLTGDIDLDPNLPGRKVFDRAVIAPDTNDVEGGFQGISFTGILDGNGHTISHLTIVGKDFLGMFGYLESDAEVKNLGVVDVNVTGSGNSVGGLVGANFFDGSVVTCYSTGTVSGRWSVGGLVGDNWWGGNITSSRSTATVDGHGAAGGLVGSNSGDIVLSYSTGTVAGRRGFFIHGEHVGGLVGDNHGSITMSYSTGMVSGDFNVGGLVGKSSSLASITTCYSSAAVSGDENLGVFAGRNVGGLVGRNEGNISMSYSCGAVNGHHWIGGLVGDNRGSITMSYSTGTVTGIEDVGGLVGDSFSMDAVVTASYWDIETSNEPNMCGVDRWGNCDNSYGKTTAEMKTATTFLDAGWDFVDVWSICEGTNYPRLAWQVPAGDFVCPDGITIDDFEFFAEYWRDDNCDISNDYCDGTDLDFSGTVDEADLEILIENWLGGGGD